MKIFRILGTGIILLILLWLVITIFLPSTVRIQRTESVNANQEIIFRELNDPGTWKLWMSPSFTNGDPVIEREGPDTGPGSVIRWESPHDSVGSGMISIMATEEPHKILLSVELAEGASMNGGWLLDSTEFKNVTNTTLYMDFKVGFFGKVFPGLMLDGWVGPMFEKIISQLSDHCEPIIPEFNPKYHYEKIFTTETHNLTVSKHCEPDEISKVLGECYDILIRESENQGLTIAGPPFSIYHHYDEDSVHLEAGIQVEPAGRGAGKIKALTLPSQRAVRVDYYGSYDNIADVYRFMRGLTTRRIFTQNGPPRESYVTDPGTEPDTAKWHTQIYFPIQ